MNILIVGGGKLGGTIASTIQKNNHQVTVWDVDPAKSTTTQTPEVLVPSAQLVFFCVPSWVLREALQRIAPLANGECVFVAVSKGIEKETGKTVPQLFQELAPAIPLAVIGGPMLAAEIKSGKTAVAVVASTNHQACHTVESVMACEQIRVECSNDPVSVSYAGVLKNMYATALGVCDGLELGDNQKGWLLMRAVEEIRSIAGLLNIQESVVMGSAGLADLVATGLNPHSANRTLGFEIATKGTCNIQAEGISSIVPLRATLGDSVSQLPLLNAITAVVIDCKPAAEIFSKFFHEA